MATCAEIAQPWDGRYVGCAGGAIMSFDRVNSINGFVPATAYFGFATLQDLNYARCVSGCPDSVSCGCDRLRSQSVAQQRLAYLMRGM
jgi:hypothetical protein